MEPREPHDRSTLGADNGGFEAEDLNDVMGACIDRSEIDILLNEP